MNTYIALLRGVMPSGKNSIPQMAYLREVLEKGGFVNVKLIFKVEISSYKRSFPMRK